MKQIPLCHKCDAAITEPSQDFHGAEEFVGCLDNFDIKCWEDAKALCPLIHESREA